jgi:hypothetical protein
MPEARRIRQMMTCAANLNPIARGMIHDGFQPRGLGMALCRAAMPNAAMTMVNRIACHINT